MDENDAKFRIPLHLLFLELLGVVCLFVGLADGFADTQIVVKNYRYPGYEKTLIILGIILMIPFNGYIIKSAIKLAKSK